MTIYEILRDLGIIAVLGGAIVAILKVVFAQIKAVKKGVQALLRAQLIADYNKYTDLGYAPIYARQNFENCWSNYHGLGENGVMDDIHQKFLQLPTEPPEDKEE